MAETSPTLGQATRVWARIGFLSFGGPAAQIALMHRELVEERNWLSEKRFLNALRVKADSLTVGLSAQVINLTRLASQVV